MGWPATRRRTPDAAERRTSRYLEGLVDPAAGRRPAGRSEIPGFSRRTGKFCDLASKLPFCRKNRKSKSCACKRIPVGARNRNLCRPKRELNSPNRELREFCQSMFGPRHGRTTGEHQKRIRNRYISAIRNAIKHGFNSRRFLPSKLDFYKAACTMVVSDALPRCVGAGLRRQQIRFDDVPCFGSKKFGELSHPVVKLTR
jgi:hypothetical protein